MNLTIALTLSVIISILFAAFNNAMYGILIFVITLPTLLLFSHTLTPQKKTKVSTKPTIPKQPTNPSLRNLFAWPSLSKFRFDVDVEPQYQPILEKLAAHTIKNRDKGEKPSILTAYLIPDEENSLVQVKIANQTIGYFNISDTRSFRRRLSAKKLAGQATTCQATIVDDFHSKSREKFYRVMLDIKPFA